MRLKPWGQLCPQRVEDRGGGLGGEHCWAGSRSLGTSESLGLAREDLPERRRERGGTGIRGTEGQGGSGLQGPQLQRKGSWGPSEVAHFCSPDRLALEGLGQVEGT